MQALAYGKYVGNLLVNFDDNGEVASWVGNPVYVDHKWSQNETIEKELKYWREKVAVISNQLITTSAIHWPRTACRMNQCEIALLVADSMVEYVRKDPIQSLSICASFCEFSVQKPNQE